MDTSVRQQSGPVCITWSKTGENWDLWQKWGNQLQWSLTLFLRWRGFFLNSILFSGQCCWEAMLPGVFEEFWSLVRKEMTQINLIYHVSYPLTEKKTELTKSPHGVLLIEALSQTWCSTLQVIRLCCQTRLGQHWKLLWGSKGQTGSFLGKIPQNSR